MIVGWYSRQNGSRQVFTDLGIVPLDWTSLRVYHHWWWKSFSSRPTRFKVKADHSSTGSLWKHYICLLCIFMQFFYFEITVYFFMKQINCSIGNKLSEDAKLNDVYVMFCVVYRTLSCFLDHWGWTLTPLIDILMRLYGRPWSMPTWRTLFRAFPWPWSMTVVKGDKISGRTRQSF